MRVRSLGWEVPWFGSRSGYMRLLPALREQGIDVRCSLPRTGRLPRLCGSLFRRATHLPGRNPSTAWSELALLAGALSDESCLFHFLSEAHLDLDAGELIPPSRRIETLHLPYGCWGGEKLSLLRKRRFIILLCRAEEELFRRHLPPDASVHVIPHGVDTDFFHPGIPSNPPRILYNGVFLRDVPMLADVASLLFRRFPDLGIDALVPVHARKEEGFESLLSDPRVTFHAGLGDRELAELYRRSHLLLLPLRDSSANNAVIEAMASGLPIVTTDVGGIRDYGGGTVYPVGTRGDAQGMADLAAGYLLDRDLRDRTGQACREFALTQLSWHRIADLHREVYREMLSGT